MGKKLNVSLYTVKLLEENRRKVPCHGWAMIFVYDLKSINNKSKNGQIDFIKVTSFFTAKEPTTE
jgi:hypothetical protein